MPAVRSKTNPATHNRMTIAQAHALEKQLRIKLDLDTPIASLSGVAGGLSKLDKARLQIEYIRFIVLKAHQHDLDAKLLSPPILVDQLWHAHILDTASYVDMCENITKTGYIHHRPSGGLDGGREKRLAFTRGAYSVLWPGDEHWTWLSDDGLRKKASVNTAKVVKAADDTLESDTNTDDARDASSDSSEIWFYLKTLTGKTERVRAPSNGPFFSQIARQIGEPERNLRLILHGRQLDPERTLAYYNVKEGDTVTLVLRLCGC